MIEIKKGIKLPISGDPTNQIDETKNIKRVAINGGDYHGMKPTMLVKLGDQVKIGQALFKCKKTIGVVYTSPGAGKVVEINRGARRVFESIVIELDSQEDDQTFDNYNGASVDSLAEDSVRKLLVESGMWTSIRTRPYSKVPSPESKPSCIFINAMDTNPLAPNPEGFVKQHEKAFLDGLEVVSKLTDGGTFLCLDYKSTIKKSANPRIHIKAFNGIHPAGNVGTHMHVLAPVDEHITNWHVGYEDVVAIGKLFTTGKLFTERLISLAGPKVKNPRLIRTRLGAQVDNITDDELKDNQCRVISGSVFNGVDTAGPFKYLGRYHRQISVLADEDAREFLGWACPGASKFSLSNTFLSRLSIRKSFHFNTLLNGGKRAVLPVGLYEKVMPFDILPPQLFKSLIVKDTDEAIKLGCMELDEEDLSVCTYISPSKIDYGHHLRENLTIIEKEG